MPRNDNSSPQITNLSFKMPEKTTNQVVVQAQELNMMDVNINELSWNTNN